jgi:Glycosyl transferases group 1
MSRVAIVSLGRDRAMGEVRRVSSWRLLFEAAGAYVHELRLSPGRIPHLDGVAPVVAGRAAPERLAWSGADLRARLTELDPDVAVVVSARAFDPRATTGRWTVVVDFVDSLSRSYRDRSEIATTRFERYGFRALSLAHERVERRFEHTSIRRVAAGAADARDLGAEWVPIVSDPSLVPLPADRTTDHDVLFFGTLRYPPNIDALERLARIWPTVQRARPATTALIAGSAPPPRVRELCAAQQWELQADFASLTEIAARARVAVAPLRRTAGIQIKVLDAACLALPQVVTSAALRGYAPGFPLEPHDDDDSFGAEIIRLLEHPAEAEDQGTALVRHAQQQYSVSTWTPWAADLLAGAVQLPE